MKLKSFRNLMAICAVISCVILASTDYGQSQGGEEKREPWIPPGCEADYGPLLHKYFVKVQANVRTQVKVIFEGMSVEYVLFDNVLDRQCTLAFLSQPEFWAAGENSDSCIVLPFPFSQDRPRYQKLYIYVETPDTTIVRGLVIMK